MNDEKPEEMDENEQRLQDRKERFEDWIEDYHQRQEAYSFVQQNLDFTNWQVRAYKDRPSEADEIPSPYNPKKIERENQYLQGLYAIPSEPISPSHFSGTAVVSSSSSDVYTDLTRVGELRSCEAAKYANSYIAQYQQLQEAKDRLNQVKGLIGKLENPDTLERFDTVYKAHMEARRNPTKRRGAAMEIRTMLNGVQGDLFARAQGWPKENMTWEKMSSRLTIGEQNGVAHKELIRQESVRSSLYSRLSDVGKGIEGGAVSNLDFIWTEPLDHLYTVLGFIDFDKDIPKRG